MAPAPPSLCRVGRFRRCRGPPDSRSRCRRSAALRSAFAPAGASRRSPAGRSAGRACSRPTWNADTVALGDCRIDGGEWRRSLRAEERIVAPGQFRIASPACSREHRRRYRRSACRLENSMMPGISKLSVGDVDPEMRRDRALQPEHDANHADVRRSRRSARFQSAGKVGDDGIDVRRRHGARSRLGDAGLPSAVTPVTRPSSVTTSLDWRRKPDVAAHARQSPRSAHRPASRSRPRYSRAPPASASGASVPTRLMRVQIQAAEMLSAYS